MFAALSAWNAELAEAFGELTTPQIKRLAEYSLGVILANRSGLSCVATALAAQLGESFDRVRERLRDFYCLAPDKSGRQRRDLPVDKCFAPLLAWLLKHWPESRLPLALDASNLGDRFVVLSISVLYCGTGLPVAWMILPANAPGPWKDHWLRLLGLLKPAIPAEMDVLVLADRGLYATWLFEEICRFGWHPLLRINPPATFRAREAGVCQLVEALPGAGHRFCQAGTLFTTPGCRLACTLAGCWEETYAEPWWVVTDLPPGQVEPLWYGMRGWIECGFKHTKSGGLNWQCTRMTDAQRAMRVYLVMALASAYLACIGTPDPQAQAPADGGRGRAGGKAQGKKPSARPRQRILSVLRYGMLLAQSLIRRACAPVLKPLRPERWPPIRKLQPSGP